MRAAAAHTSSGRPGSTETGTKDTEETSNETTHTQRCGGFDGTCAINRLLLHARMLVRPPRPLAERLGTPVGLLRIVLHSRRAAAQRAASSDAGGTS
jgi:hypothetical protein